MVKLCGAKTLKGPLRDVELWRVMECKNCCRGTALFGLRWRGLAIPLLLYMTTFCNVFSALRLKEFRIPFVEEPSD